MSKVQKIEYETSAKVKLASGKEITIKGKDYFYDTKDTDLKFSVLQPIVQDFLKDNFAKKQIKTVLDKIPLTDITRYSHVITDTDKFDDDLYLYTLEENKTTKDKRGNRVNKKVYNHVVLTSTTCGNSEIVEKFLGKLINKNFLNKLNIYVNSSDDISIYLPSEKYKRIYCNGDSDFLSYRLNINTLLNPVTDEVLDSILDKSDLINDSFYKYNTSNMKDLKRELKKLLTNISK